MSLYKIQAARALKALYGAATGVEAQRIETSFPGGFNLDQWGIRSETEVPVPYNRGELVNTQPGDALHFLEPVSTPYGTTYQDVIRTDIGAGPGALQVISTDPDYVAQAWHLPVPETLPFIDPVGRNETTTIVLPTDQLQLEQIPANDFVVMPDDMGVVTVQSATGWDIPLEPIAEEQS